MNDEREKNMNDEHRQTEPMSLGADWIVERQRERQPHTIASAVERSRFAKSRSGEPDGAWSMGEKLLNALVFDRDDQLADLDYSEGDAVERLRWDFGVTADEFPALLERIRDEL